jgi:secondary thiamine-phosphate synthase enzyme|tara:strand:+ start:169 stop:579 length:411 start_codon:yes stop_codon:yes gene_type:complete
MKTHTNYITLRTNKEKEIINITNKVQDVIDNSKIKEGLVLVNSMHITSAVFINDEESGLKQDFMTWLEKLAPAGDYHHHKTGETNADAHLKRTIMGREVVVAITNGKLDFGPWEQIFYGEFDGKRDKRIMVKIIGE